MVLYSGLRTFSALGGLAMLKSFYTSLPPNILLAFVTLLAAVVPSFAEDKILGGYFEEWSIHYGRLQHCTCTRTGLPVG